MSVDIFLKGFRNLFDETLPDEIQLDTNYKDLDEWSSMMSLVIIAFVDEEFSVTLSGNDFSTSTNIIELYNIIKSKMS